MVDCVRCVNTQADCQQDDGCPTATPLCVMAESTTPSLNSAGEKCVSVSDLASFLSGLGASFNREGPEVGQDWFNYPVFFFGFGAPFSIVDNEAQFPFSFSLYTGAAMDATDRRAHISYRVFEAGLTGFSFISVSLDLS